MGLIYAKPGQPKTWSIQNLANLKLGQPKTWSTQNLACLLEIPLFPEPDLPTLSRFFVPMHARSAFFRSDTSSTGVKQRNEIDAEKNGMKKIVLFLPFFCRVSRDKNKTIYKSL